MPGADYPSRDSLLHRGGQVEQPERVADVRAGTADPLGKLLMRGTEVVEQLLIRRSLFQRVELLPVQVLHERITEHGIVVSLADDGRDHGKAGSLGRSPAALAHDELILSVPKVTNDDRLKEADLGDGES